MTGQPEHQRQPDPEPAPSRRRRAATRAEANALASAIRLRIIRLTHYRPLTNKQIAERLGKDPATTLYHVRKLVETGFLVAQPVRAGTRGAKEIPYQSTRLSWELDDKSGRGSDINQAMLEAFLGEVADAGLADLDAYRLVLQLDAAGLTELRGRIAALLHEFADREPAPAGQRIALYLATYPSE